MKSNRVCIWIFFVIPLIFTMPFCQSTIDDELDQEQSVASISFSFYDTIHLAQSFSPTYDNLTRVRLRLNKTGEISSKITVIIRDEKINNTINVATAQINGSEITTEKSWIEVTFADAILDLSKQHFIICNTTEGDENNSYLWWGIDVDNYLNGYPIFSEDYGINWMINYSADFSFQTYGKEVPKDTIIELQYLTGGPGAQINYGVKNLGETFIEKHYYYCNISGGLAFPRSGIDGQGTVNLDPGESTDRFIFPVFGFGPATVRLEIWTDGAESSIIEKDALFLFSYIYIRP